MPALITAESPCYSRPASRAAVAAGVTSYSDATLTAATGYDYRVRATNTGGDSAFTAVVSATTLPNPPAAPSALFAMVISQTRIDLGRCAEVRDSRHRLFRTNHVAFADVDTGVNASVSRCHAHVEYDAESGDYRIHDDRSAHGTGVVRHGRTMAVASGARGIRLQSGDHIVLGEARLRVMIGVGLVP